MTDQLELLSDVPVGPDVRLTTRQRLALEHIAANAPVGSDELGAMLHEERRSRGGRGHGRDERCDWCGDEGKQMGAALRAKGLVRYRRDAGWYVPGVGSGPGRRAREPVRPAGDTETVAQLGRDDPWPGGF